MTSPDELVHLYSAFGLLVALHTTDRYLPSTIDILFCDDVLNVGRSRSMNQESRKSFYTFYYYNQVRTKPKKNDNGFQFVKHVSIASTIIFSYRLSILHSAKDIKTNDGSLGVLQQKYSFENRICQVHRMRAIT